MATPTYWLGEGGGRASVGGGGGGGGGGGISEGRLYPFRQPMVLLIFEMHHNCT